MVKKSMKRKWTVMMIMSAECNVLLPDSKTNVSFADTLIRIEETLGESLQVIFSPRLMYKLGLF